MPSLNKVSYCKLIRDNIRLNGPQYEYPQSQRDGGATATGLACFVFLAASLEGCVRFCFPPLRGNARRGKQTAPTQRARGTLLLNNITTVLYYGGVRRIREQVDDLIMIGLGLTRLHQMPSTPTTRASRQIAQFPLPLPSCGDKNTARLAGKNRTT